MGGRRARSARIHGQCGAAAVEFALVMPLLFLIVFAIIDYGLFFNNALSARQGVREGVREGVVEAIPSGSCGTNPNGYLAQIACATVQRVGAIAGSTYVKVFYTSWGTGQVLTVCSMVKTSGLIGMVPYPDGGYVRARSDMSIEVATPVPSGPTSYADTLPATQSWTWCS